MLVSSFIDEGGFLKCRFSGASFYDGDLDDLLRFHKLEVLLAALEIFTIHDRLVMVDCYGVAKVVHAQNAFLFLN